MVRLLMTMLPLIAVGCTSSMKVELSPIPTVSLETTSVSVVASDRDCRQIANALIHTLRDQYGFQVTPLSPIRLTLSDCGASYETNITVTQSVTSDKFLADNRKVSMVGHSHASLSVSAYGHIQAYSIGTGFQENVVGRNAESLVTLRRVTADNLIGLVAEDLASQVSPVPKEVARRVFPNAPNHSARGLHTLAVEAESMGAFEAALEYARAAHNQRPTHQSQAYVAELDRRAQHSKQGHSP
jgi:hypothetical protein